MAPSARALLRSIERERALVVTVERERAREHRAAVNLATVVAALHGPLRAKVERLVAAAGKRGVEVLLTSGYRSFEDQQRLFDRGRKTPGPVVTKARPGESFHNVRRAVDFAPLRDGKLTWDAADPAWRIVGGLAGDIGLVWGGSWARFKDLPHVEDRWCETCRTEHASAAAFREDGTCRTAKET